MVGNRHMRNGRARTTGQRNGLVVSFGAAVALACLVAGAVYMFGRPQPLRHAEEMRLADASATIVKQTSLVPERRAIGDQRIAATPRLTGDEELAPIENSRGEKRGSSELGAREAELSPPPTTSSDNPEPKTDNPRSLLRRARRQVKNGQTQAALETSKQIASAVSDEEQRSKLRSKLQDAEAAAGAGQLVDFDSLIQLVEQVIAPNSWNNVGGPGTITSFPGGVYVDTSGLIRQRTKPEDAEELTRLRDDAQRTRSSPHPSELSQLRKVSLPRLEKEVANRLARGEPLTDAMRYLAGLQEIRYVLVYPDEQDIVVMGRAEPWKTDAEGRVVGSQSGRPVLQLEDLAVILRACFGDSQNHGLFGCGIYPRAERLQQVQEFLARSAATPIEPAQRDRWLADLRNQLGEQDIDVFGIHPGSRVAHVLVEADYRMKLVGIGLEPAAVPGIPSYFDLIGQPDDARLARPIDTLRWWFTLNYDAILTSEARDAFELRGGRVQVLSENELLTATGQRVHTGQSDPLNAQFARNFTEQFPALTARDANFADLAGIFDLAVLSGLLRGYELPRSIGWPMTTLLDPDELIVSLNPSPRSVETVMNHRVYRGRHIHAVISGGVYVNPWTVVGSDRLQYDAGDLMRIRSNARQPTAQTIPWWWD